MLIFSNQENYVHWNALLDEKKDKVNSKQLYFLILLTVNLIFKGLNINNVLPLPL